MYLYNTHIYITDDMKQRHFVIEEAGRGASSALVCLNSRFFFWGIIGKVEKAYCNIHFLLEGSLMKEKKEYGSLSSRLFLFGKVIHMRR